jgi:hypothetical protein
MAESSIINEIKRIIDSLDYGSVEVIVQNREVTQISTRIIKKTNTKPLEKSKEKIIGKVQKPSKGGINLNFKY